MATAGELRTVLLDSIELLRAGKLSANHGKAIAMLAGQMNLSMQVELNARRVEVGLVEKAIGSLEMSCGPNRTLQVEQSSAGAAGAPEDEQESGPVPGGVWGMTAPAAAPWPGAVTVHRLRDE